MLTGTSGVRVVYFYYNDGLPLYLLTLSATAEQENLTPAEKRIMTEIAALLKQQAKG